MSNVLYEELPEEWNGYLVNTWFQIGVQLSLLNDDEDLSDMERYDNMVYLLFGNEDETVREHPSGDEFNDCIKWFLNGWHHDNNSQKDKGEKVLDYYVDQWRIFSDFMNVYHINLNESDMHWWQFCGMLWNMPFEQSSFLQVVDIRDKKPRKGASFEEVKAIRNAQRIYALKRKKEEKQYSKEEEKKIDSYDEYMEQIRANRARNKEIEKEFFK